MKKNVPFKKKSLLSFAFIVLALLLGVMIGLKNAEKAKNYSAAREKEDAGRYKEAYGIYDALGNYKDSHQKKQSLEKEIPTLRFSLVEENDIISFGSFEQDDDTKELEWIVLDRRKDRVLLLSRYVLACMPYHHDNADLTWEECSLREWLNHEFISTAFTDADRQLLLEVRNRNDGNHIFETEGGNETLDMAFLLSVEEANAYFHTEEARLVNGMGEPTQVALNQGIAVSQEEGADSVYSPWWLRGPGVYQNSAAFVDTDGRVYENGAIFDNENFCGVRPAIYVKIYED